MLMSQGLWSGFAHMNVSMKMGFVEPVAKIDAESAKC